MQDKGKTNHALCILLEATKSSLIIFEFGISLLLLSDLLQEYTKYLEYDKRYTSQVATREWKSTPARVCGERASRSLLILLIFIQFQGR